MKVDTTKLKKSSSELTPECRQLIDQITACQTPAELLQFLDTVHIWIYGKCELYHWIDILDRFDRVLEEAARPLEDNEYVLYCDTHFGPLDTKLLLLVLNFTTLLIEHSFSRHLYNSVEHLTQLLSSENMDIVLAVLNLLYMFSKRSNFIPRLSFEKKEMLLIKLFNTAERWGDPNYGLALIDCCMRKPKLEFLYQLFIEYMDDKGHMTLLEIPDMMDMCAKASPATVTKAIVDQMVRPSAAVKMRIAHRVRLVSGFKNDKLRLQFVQARLQAVSVLIYSNALNDNTDKVLYPGFGEELCELIDKEDVHLVEIRAAVLRTLTAMLHFDRNPNVPRPASRLPKIIQYTGAERQSGILPLLVRDCINSLTGNGNSEKYPLILATSLFSLLYHLASYEIGGHALVKSGMMQSLLRVISWPGMDLEHITFVTRAVRVIDLITNIDIAKFHQNNGLNVFIDRLEKEVNSCRKVLDEKSTDNNIEDAQELHNVVEEENAQAQREAQAENNAELVSAADEEMQAAPRRRNSGDSDIVILDEVILDSPNYSPTSELATGLPPTSPNSQGESSNNATSATNPEESRDADLDGDQIQYPANSYYSRPFNERNAEYNQMLQANAAKRPACVTQRAALLKSMLNFLKKSIQDHSHFNGMRNIMETSLPNSLRHIISNAEYYGPSLFLLATDVVTVYVFNEPSLLSSLQDSGLTAVMLQSLLRKDVPATREVLGSLPNVFSALCLNERGLMEFMSYEPFDKLLKVLLSPDYLVAMRRRRSSDPVGDTATNLGNATDELMKHHPYLRTDATEAIVRLLNELVRLGSDINFVCWRANKDTTPAANSAGSSDNATGSQANVTAASAAAVSNADANAAAETEHDSSGEDDDDDDEMSSASQQQSSAQQQHRQNRATPTSQPARSQTLEREAIPLIDYILNVMKFLEAIFNNSSNGEHCHEFVLHGGLKPLLQLLSLPNLPVDSPVSTTAQAVANVCKSILNLAHETKVIDIALQQLSQIVAKLKPLIRNFSFPGGSVLLCELLSCPRPEDGFSVAEFTPLLHAMSSVHGYVVMLVCLCRNASNEMRSMLLMRWGAKQESGLYLLKHLVQLYISLVWESTILLSLCSEEPFAKNSTDWHVDEMCNLLPIIRDVNKESTAMDATAGEQITAEQKFERSANAFKAKLKPEDQLRYIKSLLAASSRLGRALAELFGTLVKLSVGSPQSRQRRINEYTSGIGTPSADAKEIARVLSSILVNGFQHENIMPKPAPKLKLTFLICSVGFTGPMLFDDKRNAFHLMLSQFCEENGLKAYFDMFYWALSLDNPPSKFSYEQCLSTANVLEDHEDDERDLPEGTSEFLDAWLQLLEKMVNPRAIIDSPYSIVNVAKFESAFYMVQVHQLALHAIRRIWKRQPLPHYQLSMTETMITILKHLVKFHSVMRLQYNQRMEELANLAKKKEKEAAEDAADVNKDHLKLLTDMGFATQHVIEALLITRSLEEATDFLLNYPPRETSTPNTVASDAAAGNNAMEVDAVPTNIGMNNPADSQPSTSTGISSNNDGAAENKSKIDYTKLPLISEKTFAEFCKQALERTFCFMESMPESIVTAGAELIYVLYKRHSLAERHLFVLNLARDLGELTQQASENLPTCILNQFQVEEIVNGTIATKLFIRLKVSIILLEETYSDMRIDYCMELVYEETLSSLISLLKKTVEMMEEQENYLQRIQPRWLQVLLEFIDALDNVCTILQRKANMRAVSSENWKWYDSSMGKWNGYSEANNSIIRNAFNMGERSVNINIGRQRYTVNFNCMKQVSEASGTHRPVLPSLRLTEALCNYTNGAPHNRTDKMVMRTIRTRPDGKGVVQHDEILHLDSLVNVDVNGAKQGNASRACVGTVSTGVPIVLGSMDARLGNENTERVPTPPLPIPGSAQPQAQTQQQASTSTTATTATADFGMTTSQPTANNTEQNQLNVYSADPARLRQPTPGPAASSTTATTSTATAATQSEDLSQSASKKRDKAKCSAGQKGNGATAKKSIIILREENIGLALFDTPEIVAYLTRILNPKLQVDFETKMSVLKLCARLTKDYKNARAFYKHGGITQLLQMEQGCSFMGFPTFAIVIIRHLLEPPPVLQDAIERILSIRTWPTMPVGHRDLIFLLTQVSSAVARHPKIFLAAAKQVLRCDYTFSLMDSRFLVRSALAGNRRNTATNSTANTKNDTPPTESTSNTESNKPASSSTKSNPNQTKIWGKKVELLTDIETCMCVMKDLLRAIVQPCIHYGVSQDSDSTDVYDDASGKGFAPTSAQTENSFYNRKQTTMSSAQNAQNSQIPGEKIEPCCCSWHIPNSTHWHSKPLLSRATLLKILADSVRSYQSLIPRIIVEHVYTPDDSILIEKNQSFLSFILDKFLPIVRHNQDPGVSMMSRVLIASLADCYGQNAVQIKVVEEINAALVRILALPDSSEKHTRLQVIIGLLPTLIDNPMVLWNKAQFPRNHMFRILLRQGIMTDLTKIAQYKDLSNSNTVNTIYSILRPMEILLRVAAASGPLSKRLYFGSAPNGMSTIMNRRFYPRFLTRTGGGLAGFTAERGTGSGGSSGRETVLRDIIRNVFADRQAHAFDLFLNADGLLVDSEDTSPNNGASGDDELEDNDLAQRNFSRSERTNLNLDRLWDDLMQNDGLRVVGPNAGGNQSSSTNATVTGTDAHRRSENDDETSNNDAGAGGGSDGASSTSETAANVAETAASILGDVTSSDSDSESTENENHDEEDEDDVVVDNNDAGGDNQSETDVDDEQAQHQYIQVYQRHIYEAESSETASNDADVDGDEEDADMERRTQAERVEPQNDSNEDIPALIPLEDASSVSALASEDAPMLETENATHEISGSSTLSELAARTSEPNSESNSAVSVPSVNTQNTVSAASNNSGSVRTIPSFSWMQPRLSTHDNSETLFRRNVEMHMNFNTERSNNTAHSVPLVASGANTQPPVGTPAGITSAANNVNTGNGVGSAANAMRRDQSRRLIFLDQQYCAPMPSYHNPTEEGQMELFNQDALHWWLEEAKHLDLESQTDACMYVAHLLVPHLLRELKATPAPKKAAETTASTQSDANNGNIRRSAIPILLQGPGTTDRRRLHALEIIDPALAPQASDAVQGTAETRNAELSTPTTDNAPTYLQIRFPRSELRTMPRLIPRDMRPVRLNLLSDDDIDAEAEAEAEAENEVDVDAEAEGDASLDGEAESNTSRNLDTSGHDDDDDEDDEEDDEDVFSDGVEEEGIGDDEDDDFDDDVEEEVMGDDEDADHNVTFIEEEPMHPGFDWEQEEEEALEALERQALSNLLNRPRPASAPAATLATRPSGGPNDTTTTAAAAATPSNEPIAEVEEESQPLLSQATPSNDTVVELTSTVAVETVTETTNAASNTSNEINLSTQVTTETAAVAPVPSVPAAEEITTPAVSVPNPAAGDSAESNNAVENVATTTTTTNTGSGVAGGAEAPVAAASNIPEMSPEVRAALGDLVVPEGVDPSFLAALPSEMREEVIQEHLRIQRIRQRAQQNAIQVAHDALVEVNPEFLAALPPNIQSEVLMQQRIEQQRQAAQNSNPDEPVDTAAFFQNLPERLRQTILTDMEDSQIASLPPDIAAEAQYLRRDWETRNGARMDTNNSNSLYSRWHTNSVWYDVNGATTIPQHHHATIVHHHQQHHQMQGKPMALILMEEDNILLDPDSLATLLLFLFIEDGKMNYARLHRVIRNLCYHVPTREWVINALISIIKRTNEGELNGIKRKRVKPQWLNLRVDAAFGYKSNVFIINKIKDSASGDEDLKLGSGTGMKGEYSISVNPQAAQMVVRNCLDLLFVLAKNFPRSFVPYNNENKKTTTTGNSENNEKALGPIVYPNSSHQADPDLFEVQSARVSVRAADLSKLDDAPSTSKAAAVRNQTKKNNSNQVKLPRTLQHYNTNSANFWDVLLNIDQLTPERANHVHLFPLSSQPKWEWNNKQPDFMPFNESPFAKLLEMLPYKVICRSPQLTDLLIKLLASLSGELPREEETVDTQSQAQAQTPPSSATSNTTSTVGDASAPATPVSTGAKSKKEKLEKEKEAPEEKQQTPKRKMYSKNFSQLQLIIEVLTHQCGTTEGLDNVSKLIVHLSQCSPASNAIFLQYLRAATLGLAQEVREAIQCLLDEIRAYNAANRDKVALNNSPASTSNNSLNVRHGMMQDRFTTENIVISASSTIKPTCELQLPAMKRLLSGSSAQVYFLRTLKIFMLIRELFEVQENQTNNTANTPATKPTLSQIICLDDLWNTLSECLVALEDSKDEYAVLVLQPTVEAFFLIHASHKKVPKRRENNTNPYRMDNSNIFRRTSNAPAIPTPEAFVVPQAPAANRAAPAVVENNVVETAGDAANLAATTAKPAATNVTPASTVDQQQQNEDRQKFLAFAEKHRTVLNQILRQSPTHLSDGPFAVLVDHTRILDFDVKRKYFQKELERIDEGVRREESTVAVKRVTVFEDSFRILYRLAPEEWKNRFYIVFEDEEGQDAGGLLREWYVIISREIFNPMYALFCVSPGDRVTYMINPSSHANPNHLSYFKFVGRIIAKAVHDNKLLECYFTRSFYKHILGKQVKYTDMESQDYEFYKGLDYLMKNDISTLGYELTFSTEVQEFGVTQVRDLIPSGRDILVTEENKFEYVQLVCQLKMSDSIRHQLDAFLEGFYDIIPKHLISIFNEQELELLISGLPDIDIEDLKANTEYHKYTSKSIQIQWFWRALRSFDQADRAKFLQFVTGTSKVPLQGFGSLEGMNGIQKFQIHRDDRSTDRLPCAHTCFNQLDLPMYKSYEKLRSCLLKAIHECSEGFGFA